MTKWKSLFGVVLVVGCPACFPADTASPSDGDILTLLRGMNAGESYSSNGTTITLHQKAAGVADANGWYGAKSTKGGFSVRLPVPFNDATTVSAPDKGVVFEVYTIAGAGPRNDGARFLITCFARSDGKVPEGAVKAAVQGVEALATKFESKPYAQEGTTDGVEYRGISVNGEHFAGRALLIPGKLCQLAADFDAPEGKAVPPDVQTVLDSFRPPVAPKR